MSRESSFFSLTPERVLEAAERAGLEVTGRCFALNSYENRVYDIELEEPEPVTGRKRHIIAKFYRPGRWTEEQILEEHTFIQELRDAEVPAIAPIAFNEGKTLASFEGESGPIFYTIFPRVGGRAPDELNLDQYVRVGSLLARIHSVGASKPARHRVELTTQTFGEAPLDVLISGKWIDASVESRFVEAARAIIVSLDRAGLNAVPKIRTHGDCHLGNLLINPEGQFSFVDFDDHMSAQASQDLWLILPDRVESCQPQWQALAEGYEMLRAFPWEQRKWIEGLRALRMIHYSAWIARRWDDPAFPRIFPQYRTHEYWRRLTEDLVQQRSLIEEAFS